jgi:predicted AAA+ superfamily ATPase
LSPSFIKLIQKTFNISVFIESGTFLGATVENALSYMEKIYSIELSEILYEKAVEKFKNYPQVKIIHGSSDKILTELLPTLDASERICFWLDGHYSAGITALGNKETPLVEELIAIKNSGIKNALILVDDIRECFYHGKDYPSVEKVKNLILDINSDYQFYIYGDMAIAFLPSDSITVSSLISLMTTLYLLPPTSPVEIQSLKNLQSKFHIYPALDRYFNIAHQ